MVLYRFTERFTTSKKDLGLPVLVLRMKCNLTA